MAKKQVLDIPTPSHNQTLIIGSTIKDTLIKKYDKILLVVDKRVQGI